MRPNVCDIPGCKETAAEGLRLCQRHCARQAYRVCKVHGYSFIGRWDFADLGIRAGVGVIENALLLLLFERNQTGPFLPEGEDRWHEPESGKAYEFLRQHLREILAANNLIRP